jgi:hypothetical protein
MQTVELQTHLRYRMETPSGTHEDPSDYLMDCSAEIVGRTFDESCEVRLGFIEFTLIRVTLACEQGANLFTVFDHDEKVLHLAEALFDRDFAEYVKPVQAAFPETFEHEDILYVREIEILPVARGQRLGLSALYRVARDWDGGCGLVALDPHPMQCGKSGVDEAEWQRLELGGFPADVKSARERLARHFGGLGFKTIGTSPYLLRSSKLRHIPVDELDIRNSVLVPETMLDSPNEGLV